VKAEIIHENGRRYFILLESIWCGHKWVPAGFKHDGASFPKILKGLVPDWILDHEAAIGHDHDYAVQEVCRLVADWRMFLNFGRIDPPVSMWLRILMFVGVRLFGWYAWGKHKQRLKIERQIQAYHELLKKKGLIIEKSK
jgi:hypothetical protein